MQTRLTAINIAGGIDRESRMSKTYVFFNCDEHGGSESMNPYYNSCAYRRRAGRRALWRKIKEQMESDTIKVTENNISAIRNAVLEGDPLDANSFMTYGKIVSFQECY